MSARWATDLRASREHPHGVGDPRRLLQDGASYEDRAGCSR